MDAVTIEEAREISEGLDTDQDRAEGARPRRASHMRTRPHMDNFCVMMTKKMRSGFLVFPKHYLHLLEKVEMQLRFVLIFV